MVNVAGETLREIYCSPLIGCETASIIDLMYAWRRGVIVATTTTNLCHVAVIPVSVRRNISRLLQPSGYNTCSGSDMTGVQIQARASVYSGYIIGLISRRIQTVRLCPV